MVEKKDLKWTKEDDEAVVEYIQKVNSGEIKVMKIDDAIELLRKKEVTFCDILPHCEVHGHDIEFGEPTCIDIIGTRARTDRCKYCGMERDVLVVENSNRLRLSSTHYPDGEWH